MSLQIFESESEEEKRHQRTRRERERERDRTSNNIRIRNIRRRRQIARILETLKRTETLETRSAAGSWTADQSRLIGTSDHIADQAKSECGRQKAEQINGERERKEQR